MYDPPFHLTSLHDLSTQSKAGLDHLSNEQPKKYEKKSCLFTLFTPSSLSDQSDRIIRFDVVPWYDQFVEQKNLTRDRSPKNRVCSRNGDISTTMSAITPFDLLLSFFFVCVGSSTMAASSSFFCLLIFCMILWTMTTVGVGECTWPFWTTTTGGRERCGGGWKSNKAARSFYLAMRERGSLLFIVFLLGREKGERRKETKARHPFLLSWADWQDDERKKKALPGLFLFPFTSCFFSPENQDLSESDHPSPSSSVDQMVKKTLWPSHPSVSHVWEIEKSMPPETKNCTNHRRRVWSKKNGGLGTRQ